MPNISKEQIEQVIASLDYDAPEARLDEVAVMMKWLLAQPEGEPVGIVVYKPKMLRVGALNTAGMALPDGTRLYTHPAPFTSVTADDVTDEMVDSLDGYDFINYAEPKALIAATVNAYMKGQQ